MATFTITDNPSGPNEIAPGTIDLASFSDGDTFIIADNVDTDITFEDSANSGNSFNIEFNDSLTNDIKVSIKDDLQANVTVADNVDLGDDFEFKANDAGPLNFTAGDAVNLGKKFEGPKDASTDFTAGDNLTAGEMKFGDEDDQIKIGDGGIFDNGKFELKKGDDTLDIGDTSSTLDIRGGNGNDKITLGETAGLKLNAGNGDDQIIAAIDDNGGGDYEFKGGGGDDTLSITGLTNSQAEDVVDDIRSRTSNEVYNDNGTPGNFLDDVITDDNIKGSNIDVGNAKIKKISDFEKVDFVCFAAGTLISTSNGARQIEDLVCGDRVLTMDNGYQPIRWIGGRHVTAAELVANPKLRPIRIRAGALGRKVPDTDLIVSRQHRVLVYSEIANRMLGCREILMPAVKLLAIDGIAVADDIVDVAYWHMLFENHEVIWSNGAPTESLFTGPEALKSVGPEAREEILSLFPQLADPDFQPTVARFIPSQAKRAKQLVARHQKNNKPLVILS